MSKVARVAGYVWAAPLTLFGLIYVTLFTLLGWYKRIGRFDDALGWALVQEKVPQWLNRAWLHWDGHTVGQVIVLKHDVASDRGKVILRHEQEHVRQCMVLGVFQPVMYVLTYLSIKVACRYADPYYDSSFEIDARRAAGQIIDVVGTIKKIQAIQARANSK